MPSIFGAPIPTVSIPSEMADESSILAHLGLSQKELKKIWWFRSRMYRQFEIHKGNGKKRLISAPNDRLKYFQRKLVALLFKLYRVRNPVHGFVEGKSIKSNASSHLGKRFVLNIDLKDFFPSISEGRVTGVLVSLGVDKRVASIVARLSCNNGCLPQGAPTSPILSNMICFRLDRELLAYAKEMHCIYTRYADDITFSSYKPLVALFEGQTLPAGHLKPDLLAATFRMIFQRNGFEINEKKVHYADRHSRRMVTGLKINDILNVDRRYIRNIRATLYSISKHGYECAQKDFKAKHLGRSELSAHLRGEITWLRNIRGQSDPVFRAIATKFNILFPLHKIKFTPSLDEIRERAVWVVEDSENQGTAFFLKDIGLVTAAHCVEGVDEIDVFHPKNWANKFPTKVMKRDKHLDLAILSHSIPPTEFYEFELSNKVVTSGDVVTAVGYPNFGPGDKLNTRNGKVSSLPTKHAVSLIEVDQKLPQGMSGGPILDSGDAVIGIIHKGGPLEPRDFAIHYIELKKWLSP